MFLMLLISTQELIMWFCLPKDINKAHNQVFLEIKKWRHLFQYNLVWKIIFQFIKDEKIDV